MSPRRGRGLSGKAAARALVALQALCVLGPVAIIVVWAFTASWPWPSLLPETLSARGVEELFGPAQRLTDVLGTSVGIALATAVLTTTVAALAGRALSRYRFAGREVFRFAVLTPFLIPATVFAMGVQVAFIRAGLAGTVAGVVVSHVIVALPYASLIMVDAMDGGWLPPRGTGAPVRGRQRADVGDGDSARARPLSSVGGLDELHPVVLPVLHHAARGGGEGEDAGARHVPVPGRRRPHHRECLRRGVPRRHAHRLSAVRGAAAQAGLP